MSDEPFLSRWSRRKLASKAAPAGPAADATPAEASPAVPPNTASTATEPAEPAPLPPVESLTPESDFTPFMRQETDPALRQQALKTLFTDPRFNVMDGLDVYIDDYSKPDPLPPGWLEQLNQVARLGEYRPPAPVDEPDAAEEPADALPTPRAAETAQAEVSTPLTPSADDPPPGGKTPS